MTTTVIARRGGRGMYPRQRGVQRSSEGKRRTLPEYLEPNEVEALN